jgi:putative hydrolase of the HAD superfamily
MAEVTAIFTDLGGVVLSNGWDRNSRRKAMEKFGLDAEEFENRHELMLHAFETGRAGLEEYLDRTVFYLPRPFTREEFKAYIFAQSHAYPEALAVFAEMAAPGRYLMAALNNESVELNEFRIRHFRLRQYFSIFLSSCYLGVRKPEEAIYRLALQITQRAPKECVFIDDRELNLECARRLGLRVIYYRSPTELREDLRKNGVVVNSRERGGSWTLE